MLMEDDRKGYVGYLFEIAADIAYCYDEMNNPEKYGLSGNESKHDYYNRLLRIKKAADELKEDEDFFVDARNMTKCMCDDCYKEYRKKKNLEAVKRYQSKL